MRNSLMHNASYENFYLSHAEIGRELHLTKTRHAGFIHVNTLAMYDDFVATLERFQKDIRVDEVMRKRAADRLEWDETVYPNEWKETSLFVDPSIPIPSPPPPVSFIRFK
jgi:hypothetical protein